MSASTAPCRADKYGLPTTKPSGAGMPAPVVAFTAAPAAYHGPSTPAVLAQRKQHLSDGQYHFYKSPLMLVEGRMQYCFDENGRQFLDAYSNVCHIGHAHPAYVRRVQDAVSAIASNTRYLHPTIVEYAGRLKQKLPPKLDVVYFVNSGSEANDLAMRLARVFTKKTKVACFRGAYHGTTMTCTGVSTSLSTGTTEGSADLAYCGRDVVVVPCPDPYRGPHKGSDPQCADKYIADAVEALAPHRTDVAAFIAESVQGVGGQIVYPEGYMQKLSAHIRANGGVTIADEVQTGFGRSGTHFWAFETQGVVPDIVVMGKPIGNGFPLGCVATTREIATAFDGAQYFNTFGGNPVACAAGLAVLDVIEADRLQERALHVSGHWMRQLAAVRERHPLVGDVRGVGLFLGIELVRDRVTLEPAPEETALAMELCRAYGVLVGKGGVHNNVLRIKPPLCFGQEDADFATTVLDRVFAEIEHDPVAAAASIGLTFKAAAKARRPAVSSAAAAAEVLAAPPVSVVHCGKPVAVRRDREDGEVPLPAFMNISPSPTMRRKAEMPPPGLDVSGTPARPSMEVQRMLASPTTGAPSGNVSAQRLRALQECVAATLQQPQQQH